jgi:hypothetical protein
LTPRGNAINSELVSIDIPPADRALNIVLLELDAPWHSVAPIEDVLTALEQINLGLARMSVDLEETWSAYDRRAASSALWKGVDKRTAVTLSSADGRRRATVSRYDRMPKTGAPVHRNTVTFTLPAEDLQARGLKRIEANIDTVAASLAAFTVAVASACRPVRFPTLMDSPQPPVPLEQTAWLHVVAERAWPLLGLAVHVPGPPLRAERRPDGTVWIWSYADPLLYDTEEAIAGMRAFNVQMRAPA